jgi:hypothetical protein
MLDVQFSSELEVMSVKAVVTLSRFMKCLPCFPVAALFVLRSDTGP